MISEEYLIAGENSKKVKTVSQEKYNYISVVELNKESLLQLKQQEITLDDLIYARAPLARSTVVNECTTTDGFEVTNRALFPE